MFGLTGSVAGAQSPGSTAPSVPPRVELSSSSACGQTIDGFGTTAPPKLADEPWVQELYFGDLAASVLRVDLTPRFRSPVSDVAYNSPWHHGDPALPGPEGNNVRTYHDLTDYSRTWNGRSSPIVVLGPNVEQNLAYFEYRGAHVSSVGALAHQGVKRASKTEPLKLIGSIWSPAPWLKRTSGGHFEGSGEVMPRSGTPWPFIWAGNFSGGKLDTTNQPRAELDDGLEHTSALTQFVRITAAYVLGFQRRFGVRFYALSLQNELNFETFYNSCSYPDTNSYLGALKALRREFDRHAELRSIELIGPEDLIESNAYALWQYGSERSAVHKNLQHLAAIAREPEAASALSFFALHAYSRDGVHGSGGDTQMWRWWLDGWSRAPAPGLPERVLGARAYRKKSWMTESSGEANVWAPAPGGPLFDSALGLALKVHHALTAGEESAWLYWQLLDDKPVNGESLTDATLRGRSPKYVAYKHFARFIRPESCRLELPAESAATGPELFVSAYRHRQHGVTLVLINTSSRLQTVTLHGLVTAQQTVPLYLSDGAELWQTRTLRAKAGVVTVELPAQSVATVLSARGPAAQAPRK